MYGVILVFGDEAASDAALVGDDEEGKACVLQAAQGRGDSRENAHPRRVAAIGRVLHEGAVAIEKHSAHIQRKAASSSAGETVAVPSLPTTIPLARLASSAAS